MTATNPATKWGVALARLSGASAAYSVTALYGGFPEPDQFGWETFAGSLAEACVAFRKRARVNGCTVLS